MSFSAEPIIFVTGASRSGTTVIAHMLGKHSEIAALKEMQYFGEFCDPRRDPATHPIDALDAVAALFARQEEGVLAAQGRRSSDPAVAQLVASLPDDAGAAEIFASAAAAFASRAGKAVPCEQTPRNIYYARALLEWYPNARFVHVVRDPRAVMASQKFRWRRRSLAANPSRISRRQQLRTWVNYHPYTVTQLWASATHLALELQEHPRVRLLRFEDLLLEPERRMREVCEFLGIEFEPPMLETEHVNSSYVSASTVVRGLNTAAIDAWRGRLSRDERAHAHHRCGRLMTQLGYEDEPVETSAFGMLAFGVRYVVHLAGAAVVNPHRLWIQGRALLAVSPARVARSVGTRRDAAIESPVEKSPSEPTSSVTSAVDAESVNVFGLPCRDVDLDAAAHDLVQCAADGVRRWVVFVNAHSINVRARDPEMRKALRRADVIFADGVGMAMAARLQGRRLRHNVNGTDLFPFLCRHAAEEGVSLAMLGAAPSVVRACADATERQHPGLRVVWFHHGFVKEADAQRLIDEINASGAGILLVAMGVPRQERWILEHRHLIEVPVVMGVGGLFDFVSGRVPRAPKGFRMLRLEWLFRLMVEPRRLFRRYVFGNPLFLVRACRYAVAGRASSQAPQEVPHR